MVDLKEKSTVESHLPVMSDLTGQSLNTIINDDVSGVDFDHELKFLSDFRILK